MPNERDSEYASSTEVTEIEFHRRASDYPRGGDELHATRGCASRGVSVFMYVLSFGAVSQAWPMRRTEVTTRCSYEELKHQIHTRGHASGSTYVTFLMFSAAIRYRYCIRGAFGKLSHRNTSRRSLRAKKTLTGKTATSELQSHSIKNSII